MSVPQADREAIARTLYKSRGQFDDVTVKLHFDWYHDPSATQNADARMGIAHCYRDADAVLSLVPAKARTSQLSDDDIREIAHRHCICLCDDKPGVFVNHTNLCDDIRAAIREVLTLTPQQPAKAGAGDETCTINMRVNRKTLSVIDEAANALGKTRSEFLRDCARQDAEAAFTPQPEARAGWQPSERRLTAIIKDFTICTSRDPTTNGCLRETCYCEAAGKAIHTLLSASPTPSLPDGRLQRVADDLADALRHLNAAVTDAGGFDTPKLRIAGDLGSAALDAYLALHTATPSSLPDGEWGAEKLIVLLREIERQELNVARSTDMTRHSMREGAMDIVNMIRNALPSPPPESSTS